jgi:hypothetical protein
MADRADRGCPVQSTGLWLDVAQAVLIHANADSGAGPPVIEAWIHLFQKSFAQLVDSQAALEVIGLCR